MIIFLDGVPTNYLAQHSQNTEVSFPRTQSVK